jgi:hypothetical protein
MRGASTNAEDATVPPMGRGITAAGGWLCSLSAGMWPSRAGHGFAAEPGMGTISTALPSSSEESLPENVSDKPLPENDTISSNGSLWDGLSDESTQPRADQAMEDVTPSQDTDPSSCDEDDGKSAEEEVE